MTERDRKFKDNLNRYLSRSLFLEMAPPDKKDQILYSLSSEDQLARDGSGSIPSLYRLYLEESDPLEFNFANKYFYDYDHWVQICETKWMAPIIERWRRDLDQKIKTEAIQVLREDAKSGSRTSVSSAKFLATKGWEEKLPATARAKLFEKNRKKDKVQSQIEEDWERLNGQETAN